MKKLLSILMTVLVFSTCFMAGCSNDKGDVETATEEITFAENVAAIVGNSEITMDELAVYVDSVTYQLQSYTGNAPGWEDIVGSNGLTAHDTIIEYAVEEAWYQNAMLLMCMDEGICTEDEIDEAFDDYVELYGGEEAFQETLDATGLTEAGFRKYVAANCAYDALRNYVCSDEDAAELYNDKVLTAKHILISFDGRESEEAAYDEISAIYERVLAGENFESLIDELSEDPGQDSSAGYTFVEGDMVDEFYNGTLNLKIGEVSEPVKTSYGYHIIKRYENPGSDDENYESYITSIKENELSQYFTEEKMNDMLEKYPLYKNEDLIKTIDLSKYTVTQETETE
ncbi:MAG: peptidylprolyl isomerase [Clostridia bacterium]